MCAELVILQPGRRGKAERAVHDADAHKCIMHATGTAETDIEPFANEYAVILHFTDNGKKVTKFL
jgi:ketosteroid isomerase-like protein